TGPYRNSNLADVVRQDQDNPDVGAIQLGDFQFYRPSYNAPAAFIAGPIYDGSRLVGILAAQLPIDEINRVLTGSQNWQQDGLGDTGETYLVGDDLRLRSAARLLIESPEEYFGILRDSRIDPETVDLIEQLQTSLLLHPIETDAAKDVIVGESGTRIMPGYYGSDVLSSYAPLNIQGVNWGIVSEMALAEAYVPVNTLQNYLLLSIIVLILLVTLFATIVAQRFTRPIDLMVQFSQDVDNHEAIPDLEITERNEFSELAQIVNRMAQKIREEAATITSIKQEKESLLLNILPPLVMERWQQGETRVLDQAQQVVIIAIQILGLADSQAKVGANQTADALDEWVTLLDEQGSLKDIERLNCFGDRYVAACGLTKPRLDLIKRGVDFAQDALNLIKDIDQKHGLSLSLGIGIHTGSVTTALIGQKKFQYDVWGEPVSVASQLSQQTEPNTIRITQAVYDRVQEFFQFESGQPVLLAGNRSMPTWVLGKSGMSDLISQLTTGLGWGDEGENSASGNSPNPTNKEDTNKEDTNKEDTNKEDTNKEDNWL
ncbi:MAG: hypothetical protein F6K30_26230, partial [Cyanothece sp. SIO2G6]|nr:hypothetical protein [Cyanothece sp. SIO2G6]